MPTATLLPTGETLVWVEGTGGSGAAVGGADAFDATVLASDDADTTYFFWSNVTNLNIEAYTTVTLPPTAVVTRLELLIRLKSFDSPIVDTLGAGVYLNNLRPGEPHGYLGFPDLTVAAVAGWQTVSVTYGPAELLVGLAGLSSPATMADLADAITTGNFLASISQSGDTNATLHLTYTPIIVTYTTTTAPLRQFPRDDGLVGTSVARQASSATSRQASLRQLPVGYL